MGYATATWAGFGEALAAIAGVLTGLLFVALSVERFSPAMITTVRIGVADTTLLVKAGGGLYWLIPAAVASLLGGAVNARLFLVKVTSQSKGGSALRA